MQLAGQESQTHKNDVTELIDKKMIEQKELNDRRKDISDQLEAELKDIIEKDNEVQAIADRMRHIYETIADWEANWPGNTPQQGTGASVPDG